MQELVLATVVAEIKNVFIQDINDLDMIELLYRGVAEPLGIKLNKVQKGAVSLIVNSQPKGNVLKVIWGNSQNPKVKASIGEFFKRNVIKRFMPDVEEEIIFHLRGVIKDDKKISDSKRSEIQISSSYPVRKDACRIFLCGWQGQGD